MRAVSSFRQSLGIVEVFILGTRRSHSITAGVGCALTAFALHQFGPEHIPGSSSTCHS